MYLLRCHDTLSDILPQLLGTVRNRNLCALKIPN